VIKTRIENSGPSTLVLIAALNEEEGILPTIGEIREFVSEPSILVVDGRSVDGTAKIAEGLSAQVIFQKGLGKGDAVARAVPKMVKNGLKPFFAYVGSLWICVLSVFWPCLRNKNHFTPI
jgi:glycosyltransferase involved in cell wall biosynthesis